MSQADDELKAIESVARRAAKLTRTLAALILTPAVLATFGVYFVVRELQFAAWGANIPYLSMGIAVLLTLAPAIFIARQVGRLAVRTRRGSWIIEAARKHRVTVAVIEESFGDWS